MIIYPCVLAGIECIHTYIHVQSHRPVSVAHVRQIAPHNNPFNVHKPGQNKKLHLDPFLYPLIMLILNSLYFK